MTSPSTPTKGALLYFLNENEKELKELNERLAKCLEELKTLERSNIKLTEENKTLIKSNTKLTSEITIVKQTAETESENQRSFFESKIAEAIRQIENRKNVALADELQKK